MDISMEQLWNTIMSYAPDILLAILTLIIGFWIIGWITRMARKAMIKRGVDETLHPFLSSLISIGLKVLLLISIAGMFGIETTSFIAVIGAMAFAIGLALQGTLGHFASGVLLLIFKPYRTGDLVEIAGFTGTIDSVQVLYTVMMQPNNEKVYIPNGKVMSDAIKNLSGQETMRINITFGIDYEDDIDKAREVIIQTINQHDAVLKDQPIAVPVISLGDSSVNVSARCWTKSEDYWTVHFWLQEAVKKAFDDNNISMPFPQRDVHLFEDK